jgi:flagellar biosynthesis chaperone FliJ
MAYGRDIIYTRNCIREDNKRRLRVRNYRRLLNIERENYSNLRNEYNEIKQEIKEESEELYSTREEQDKYYEKQQNHNMELITMKRRVANSVSYMKFLESKIERNLQL